MAAVKPYQVAATPNSNGYTMYLLHCSTEWERAAVTALQKRGHDVSLDRPVFINGEIYHCECFRTTVGEIEQMRILVEEEALKLQHAEVVTA